jgi:hypothetical protein
MLPAINTANARTSTALTLDLRPSAGRSRPSVPRQALRNLGGVVIMIKRPGTKPAKFKWGKLGEFLYDKLGLLWGVHDSERIDRIKPDFIIHNDSSVEQLYADLDAAMVQHYRRVIDTSFVHSPMRDVAAVRLGLTAGSVVR